MKEIVFLTGGSGFVGAAIIRALVSAGHRVRALARSEASAGTVSSLGAEPVRGDLDDEQSLADGVRGATVVVHAAGSLTSGVRYRDHERINVNGTRRVLAAARQVRKPCIVFASTLVPSWKRTFGRSLKV